MTKKVLMSHVIRTIAAFLLLQVLVSIFACSSSTQSSLGVVRIDESQIDTVSDKSLEVDIGISVARLTDEEITTQFTMCMRNHGFDILEPTKMIEIKNGPYAGDQDKVRF